jgi:hypothetical protein
MSLGGWFDRKTAIDSPGAKSRIELSKKTMYVAGLDFGSPHKVFPFSNVPGSLLNRKTSAVIWRLSPISHSRHDAPTLVRLIGFPRPNRIEVLLPASANFPPDSVIGPVIA